MFISKSILNVLLCHALSTDNYFATPEVYLFWDPREEIIPLRGMMKLLVTGNFLNLFKQFELFVLAEIYKS